MVCGVGSVCILGVLLIIVAQHVLMCFLIIDTSLIHTCLFVSLCTIKPYSFTMFTGNDPSPLTAVNARQVEIGISDILEILIRLSCLNKKIHNHDYIYVLISCMHSLSMDCFAKYATCSDHIPGIKCHFLRFYF